MNSSVLDVHEARAEVRPSPTALVVTAVVAAVVFVVLAVVVWHTHGPIDLDGVYRVSLGNPRLELVAFLGSPQFVLPVAGVLVVVSLARHDAVAAILCATAPALAGLFEIGAKHVVDRTLGASLSYPSGHAALSAALATAVAVLAVRAFSGRVAAAVSVAVFVIPLVVGLALVRLGWHYPTDVVGGVAVGVGVACGTYVALTRGIRKIRTN